MAAAATPEDSQGVAAIDPETGAVQWRYQLTQNSLSSGVLATAGGVLFVASQRCGISRPATRSRHRP